MVDSTARPCVELGVGNTREVYATAGLAGGGGGGATSFARKRYSHGTMAAAVLLTLFFSAAISIVLTRAVLLDGLELSLSIRALPVAGGALARAVKGAVGGTPAPRTQFVPAPPTPQTPSNGSGAYETVS